MVEGASPPKTLPAKLPLIDIEAATWVRIHQTARDPVYFGGVPPMYRFDAPNGEYRVLYVGRSFAAAFIETMLRMPHLKGVDRTQLEARSASELFCKSGLRMVDLRSHGLSAIGADNQLTTGPYAVSAAWALSLFKHPERPDGILYRSRHNPAHECAAIFNRNCTFSVETSVELKELPHRWGPILHHHGKHLT